MSLLKLLQSRSVIARKNLPASPPIEATAIAILALVVFGAPMVYWLMVGSLLVVAWVAFAVRIAGEAEVDVLGEHNQDTE